MLVFRDLFVLRSRLVGGLCFRLGFGARAREVMLKD